MQTNLGGATHYVNTVTEQTLVQAREKKLKPLNENLHLMLEYSTVI